MCSMRASPSRLAGAGGVPHPPSASTAATHARSAERSVRSPALFFRIFDTGRAAGRRLPELDLVAVGIDEPAEAAVFVVFHLADHLTAAGMHLSARAIEIVHYEIEHEVAGG